jgi:flagellar biosynthesis/type III secretory pathway protein FliH
MTKAMEDFPSYDPGYERITEEDVKEARKEGVAEGIEEGKAKLASEIDAVIYDLDDHQSMMKIREIINKLI